MSVIWHKVWFDLWQNKARTLLAVLSIAIGVFAVGTVFGMVDQLLSGMDAAHRAVDPSHVNVILRSYVDGDTVEGLKDVPGVVDIEPANQISVRYKLQADEAWELGTLVMRDDYAGQTYDRLELKAGAWPADESLGVERLTSAFYGMAAGDEVIFELAGTDRAFTVDGLVRHPFVPPPLFGGQPHFFTDAAGLERFGVPAGRYGQLLVQVAPYSQELAEEVAGEIRSRLGQQGFAVAVTLYQEPDAHWGRMFVEGVTVVLQVMAVASLLLSVILVVNTLTAVITQQVDQIGVIRAIGGPGGVIVKVYLAGVAVYGLLALLIALPAAALAAFGMTQWFLNLFNIDYEVFQFSTRAVVLQVVAALAVPPVAALWPVLGGAAMSVREALASYGIGSDFGSSPLDRAVDRFGERFLPAAFAAALGNMFRRKARLVLTLAVLTVAGVMYLVVMSLVSSTALTLDNDMARRGYDLRVGFTREQRAERVLALAGDVPGVESAEMWWSSNATILREGERLEDSAGLGAQLVGVPPETVMRSPLIVAGRWLAADDDQAIVIDRETGAKNGIAVGDWVTLDLGSRGSAEWEVVGVYNEVYDVGFVVEPIYAPAAAVADVTGRFNEGTQVYVRAAPTSLAGVSAVADELRSVFEAQGMDVDLYTSSIKLEERADVQSQFDPVMQMLTGLSMLMASVGGVGLMGALGIGVVERTREIGVMRAIGARSRSIMGVFVMEGMLQGLLSWVVAVPVAFVVAGPMARLLGQTMIEADLDYAFNGEAVVAWLVVVVVVSALASTVPAWRATRVSVRESLAYG